MSTIRNLRLLDALQTLTNEVLARGSLAAMEKHGKDASDEEVIHDFLNVVEPFMDPVKSHVLDALTQRLEEEAKCAEGHIADFYTGMLIHNDAEYVAGEMAKED